MRIVGGWNGARRGLSVVGLLLATTGVALAGSAQSRPIPLGVSGGNIKDSSFGFCFGGTLGGLVERGGEQYILSNNHILARINQARLREDIVQPGLVDNGCVADPDEVVADLASTERLKFMRGRREPVNYVDAAIAQVRPGKVDPSGTILQIGRLSSQIATDAPNCSVKKRGRTTALTVGMIQTVNLSVDVDYGGGRMAHFADQFTVTPPSFSDGGDSGSLIVQNESQAPRAVGLLFAGTSSYTLASPIQRVLDAFPGLSMVGSGAGQAGCSVLPGRNQAVSIKDRFKDGLFQVAGVVGVGVGLGSGAGPAIDVYLARDDGQARRRIPTQLDGLPVRVIESGEFKAR